MIRARQILLLLPLILAAGTGCGGKRGTTQAPAMPREPTPSPVTAKKERPDRRYTKDQLRNLRTIPALWNAVNHHHDQLGRTLALLAPAPRRYEVDRPPRRPSRQRLVPRPGPRRRPRPGRPAERPRPREQPRRPSPPRARWTQRAAPGAQRLCQRACRHVRSICYAGVRICQIADRLAEWPADQACERSRRRCEEAREAARRRCPPCSR